MISAVWVYRVQKAGVPLADAGIGDAYLFRPPLSDVVGVWVAIGDVTHTMCGLPHGLRYTHFRHARAASRGHARLGPRTT